MALVAKVRDTVIVAKMANLAWLVCREPLVLPV